MAGHFTCSRCGQHSYRARVQRHVNFCFPCRREREQERAEAQRQVHQAIRRGRLQRAKVLLCVDCNKPAFDWEHRDYTEPLRVVPACRSCNLKRGPAFDSKYRPAVTTEPQAA